MQPELISPIKMIKPIIRLSIPKMKPNNNDTFELDDFYLDEMNNDDDITNVDNTIFEPSVQTEIFASSENSIDGVVQFKYTFNRNMNIIDSDNELQLEEINQILSTYKDKHWILQLDCGEFEFKHALFLNNLAKLISEKYEVNLLHIEILNETWKFQTVLSMKWWFLSDKIRGTIGRCALSSAVLRPSL